MTFARNLYYAAAGQRRFLYGVPWRARFQESADVAPLTAATGLDDLGGGRVELPRASELFGRGLGPRWAPA